MKAEDFVPIFGSRGPWAVLAGSAISASPPTYAPMVLPGLWSILMALSDEVSRRDSRLGGTFNRVLKSVSPGRLCRNLKFELAMTHLDAQVPGLAIETIRALYSGLEPNPNHHALAYLHASGAVTWVLTTNFDSGIESAGSSPHETGYLPHSSTAVLKIHGDADTGDGLVATMENLTRGRALGLAHGMFSSLQGLGCRDLLVVGYGGTGDIDVFPAVVDAQKHGLSVWWSSRDGTAPDVLEAERICHELSTQDGNLLLMLASERGFSPPMSSMKFPGFAESVASAASRLRPVLVGHSDRELVKVAVSLLPEANFGWQPARLLVAAKRVLSADDFDSQMAYACERMSAYSAALGFHPVPESLPESESSVGELGNQAFLWGEAGRPARRRRLLYRVRNLVEGAEALAFRDRDPVNRGWLETEIDRCAGVWNRRQRATRATELLPIAEELRAEAGDFDSAVENVLRLRIATLRYLAAGAKEELQRSLLDATDVLRDMHALQHADGVGATERFLVGAGGRRGRDLVRGVRATVSNPIAAPPRDVWKSWLAFLQGFLPASLAIWKVDYPFETQVKWTVNLVLSTRFRLRCVFWKLQDRFAP